jgi:sec-independent protein translocase protein TatA
MQTGQVTDLGWPELLIVCVIAMMLFGTKKMPEIARSMGRSMRIVKSELRGLREDDIAAPAPTPAPAPAPAAAVQPIVIEPVAPAGPIAAPSSVRDDTPTR